MIWQAPSATLARVTNEASLYEDFRPRLTIDLGALRRNVKTLKQLRPGAALTPVVKADAYGLGAEKIVPVLMDEGCDSFFVAYPEEAPPLRKVAPPAVFYAFNAAPNTGKYDTHLRPVFYRAEDLHAWNGGYCGVQIELGMNRLGISLQDLESVAPRNDVRMVVAHMSDAGDPSSDRNALQRENFGDAVRALKGIFPDAQFSLSASGGLMLPDAVEEDATRPGIALYGASPGLQDPLEPIATFEARVLSVHEIMEGDRVGYDGKWTAPRRSRIATLSVGYADGIPRSMTNRGKVWLSGGERSMVGRISMDLTTVDVTEAGEVRVGDWAEVFGPNIIVDDLAHDAGTIGYELFTAIRGRTRRVYTGD